MFIYFVRYIPKLYIGRVYITKPLRSKSQCPKSKPRARARFC